MKKVLVYAGALALMGTVFTGCNNSDDESIVVVEPVEAKEYYNFVRNGESTVMYDGQNTRLNMVDQIVGVLKNPTYKNDKFQSMFNHQEGHDDFDGKNKAELDASNKNVKSKIASSVGLFNEGKSDLSMKIKGQFSEFLRMQAEEVFPRWEESASVGVAGVLPDGKRRVTSKGYEADQLFKKGIIGGLILDQSLNNYLVKTKNDNNDAYEAGSNFTTMEHHWDEAYGYMFGGTEGYVEGRDGKYYPDGNEFIHYATTVNKNSHFNGISYKIFRAFVDGRQAIVEKKYNLRDRNIAIIQENASKVVAVRGVYYLLEGADEIQKGTRESGFHALSEGLGFVYSLQFTHNPTTGKPYFSHEEITNILDGRLLKDNGLWTVSAEEITSVAKEIANRFGFTLDQARDRVSEAQ